MDSRDIPEVFDAGPALSPRAVRSALVCSCIGAGIWYGLIRAALWVASQLA